MKINGMSGLDHLKAYAAQLKKENTEAINQTAGQIQGDTLEISTEARDMQNYKAMLNEVSDVREDLVNSLKQKIQDGTYQPDSEKIATGLIMERLLDRAK